MSVQINMTAPANFLKALDRAVEIEKAKTLDRHVSRSSLARTAIVAFLENHADPKVRATVARAAV